MIAHIFTAPTVYDGTILEEIQDGDFVIGADRGALSVIEFGLPLHLALGDFDSVTEDEIKTIEDYADEMMSFESEKDFTDTYLAVQEAFLRGYDELYIYGGIGNRFDHSFANLKLLELGNITIKTMNETMYTLNPGEYEIINDYTYISFFALEDVTELHLDGFQYEVHDVTLTINDPLCISNQGSGILAFTKGVILVIHQNE